MQDVERRANSMVYKPLPPDRLYLDAALWDRLLADRAVGAFSPFGAPEKGAAAIDAGGRRGRDFADARTRPDVNVFEELREYVADLRQGRSEEHTSELQSLMGTSLA